MQAVIKVASGSTVNVEVQLTMTVKEVKELISTQTDTPADRQASADTSM